MIAREKQTKIGDGRTVTVRELTVAEIRRWLLDMSDDAAAETDVDVVDQLLLDDVALGDIARMTDLPVDEMDAMSPSDLRALAKVCRELNADFFSLRDRLVGIGRAAMIDRGAPIAPLASSDQSAS